MAFLLASASATCRSPAAPDAGIVATFPESSVSDVHHAAALAVVAIFVPLYVVDPARVTTSSIGSYSLWRGFMAFAEPIASVAICS